MSERRYTETEVERIFAEASTESSERSSAAPGSGSTLADLQAIGQQVGIAPHRIAEAAASLDRQGSPAARSTSLGLPIAVARSYELPRAPTDQEWAMLVAELRRTFSAQGKEDASGTLRHWRNGNLYASVEPSGSGYQLRMGSRKGDAATFNWLGSIWLLVGLIMLVVSQGGDSDVLSNALIFGGLGAGFLGANVVRLPRWAGEREAQMEYIGARAQELISPARPAEGQR